METAVEDEAADTPILTANTSPPETIFSKEPKIKISRLSDTDIDVWINTVHKYYNFVPSHVETDTKPEISKVRGYGLCSAEKHGVNQIKEEVSQDELVLKKARDTCPPWSRPSPERLLAHANALINKVSQFVTKPVNAKFGITATGTIECEPKQHVETTDKSPSSPVETSESETEQALQSASNAKPHSTVRCKICKGVFGSVKELNDHHHEDHGVIDCNLCDKKFETRSALDKHKYSHQELRFVCEDCGQSFLFKSRLDQHRIVHQDGLNYMCQCQGCSCGFKNKGDLNQHLQSHLEGWYWCDACPYKNKDKRNQDSHMRIHQKQGIGLERYKCKQCGKAMYFSTQMCHHKKAGCQLIDLRVQTEKAGTK